jgi:hypothetical protein
VNLRANVLIGGETSGRIRDAFRYRGYNAWSCDLLPCKADPSYHIQGDVRDIIDGLPLGTFDGEEFCDLSTRDKERVNIGIIDEDKADWDLFIVHPDCTYLTNSAAWALGDGPYHQKVKPGTLVGAARREARKDALAFVREIMAASANIKRVCLENPPGSIGTNIDARVYGFSHAKASQYINPHDFGEDASKKTGLWLKNLSPLQSTKKVEPRWVCCGHVMTADEIINGCNSCGGVNLAAPRWANQTNSGQNRLSPGADRWQIRSETYPGWADAMADQWG